MTFHPGRARKAEKNAHSSDPSIDRQYWAYVAADQLTDALDEIERLQGFETAARDLNNDLIRIAGERDELAARIQELEDALAEYQRLGKTIAGKVPDADECPDDLPPIGSPYRSWQITEEREEALYVMGNMKTLIACPHCKTPIEFADIPKYMAVLRGMLEEAWQ